jgi:hypothetical protein
MVVDTATSNSAASLGIPTFSNHSSFRIEVLSQENSANSTLVQTTPVRQKARTPTKTNNFFPEMKHDTDHQQSEVVMPTQWLPAQTCNVLPVNSIGSSESKVYSTFQSDVAKKDAIQRHSNPSTSHVSTVGALFTPSKILLKSEEDFRKTSSNQFQTKSATPNILTTTTPVPSSGRLFDRLKLQARLHMESNDSENSDVQLRMLTNTPSRLSIFLEDSQRPVSGVRLSEPSSLVERKLAILGDSNDDQILTLNTEKFAEMDPIKASELWQKARSDQRMLRTSQVSENFEERWKSINSIRDSMFRSGNLQYSSELPSFQPNPVPSRSKEAHMASSSVSTSIMTPRSRLEQLGSYQASGDSEMQLSDLRRSFSSKDYNRL